MFDALDFEDEDTFLATDNPAYTPVPEGGLCADCAFWSNQALCTAHACHGEDFPTGHPCFLANNIIWIRTQ